ncbi:MAG: type VI secretion system baseplate subunit TssF [Phycisphaeraceae bacterium]
MADLLDYYNQELQHLRETAGEFADAYPKIAGRLALDRFECADPYVERLLEGFAFLAARVQLKIDGEFPRFTQAIFETLYPHYLAPTPSMTVVQMHPDATEGSLAQGFEIPRGSSMRGLLGRGDQTACTYRTAHDVTLWPLEIVDAGYYSQEMARIEPPPDMPARAAIHLRLRTLANQPIRDLQLDELVLHLRGGGGQAMSLYENLMTHVTAIVAQPAARPVPWRVPVGLPKPVGFSDDHALLPYESRSFHGYRLLQEYFAMPQRFMFVAIDGLAAAVKQCDGNELDLILLMDQAQPELAHGLDASNFMLHCTPAVNLFHKRCDRIHLTERVPEFHVVSDRTRPLDFEIYQVRAVQGIGARSDAERTFRPLYEASEFQQSGSGGAYYTVARRPRLLSQQERQKGMRSSQYAGSEVYLALADADHPPYDPALRQLAVEALCTNRDLPLQMAVGAGTTDLTLESGAPVNSIRCVVGPTAPRASIAQGDAAWRLIKHLSLNYLSLAADDGASDAAAALRDLLRLYAREGDDGASRQVRGLRSVSSRAIVRRARVPGPLAFVRGVEVTLDFDETDFEGVGVFLLGSVLERFLARHASVNAFTETVLRTQDRGEIMRWQPRIGRRQSL